MSSEAEIVHVTPRPKVVKLDPNPGIVELLEDWLEQAQDGGIRGIALIAVFNNGEVESDFEGLTNGLEMIGAIEHVKMDLFNVVSPEVEDE